MVALLAALRSTVRSRTALTLEVFALRHQLAVLRRQAQSRLRLHRLDRLVWVGPSRVWASWRGAVQIVSPDTVVRSRRRSFARYWRWKSRPRHVGRPGLSADLRALIRTMQDANPTWGAPRIHGESRKLGIEVAPSTVAKYLRRRPTPPSQRWRTFLANHVSQIAAIDFFTVRTATFRVLFVFVVLSHERRRVLHFNVTEHPTAAWTAQQLREAWPRNDTPWFVVRDRDCLYGETFRAAVNGLGIDEILTAPRSPWPNAFVERLIGSIRRECLDHVIVWSERALRRHLRDHVAYDHPWRTRLSLDDDSPLGRAAETPTSRPIVAVPPRQRPTSSRRAAGGLTVRRTWSTHPAAPLTPLTRSEKRRLAAKAVRAIRARNAITPDVRMTRQRRC